MRRCDQVRKARSPDNNTGGCNEDIDGDHCEQKFSLFSFGAGNLFESGIKMAKLFHII